MASRTHQPLYVLSEDSERTRGRAAQESSVAAGKAVAEAVRTTLGPRGMDKMLVDSWRSEERRVGKECRL